MLTRAHEKLGLFNEKEAGGKLLDFSLMALDLGVFWLLVDDSLGCFTFD